ncbi:hypothetical protein B0H34DRAFT_799467 [Crassisporium funariophilum]|nr:hypothetical protein B0H34DRAFT_799467 [Crassisporium funariophilum]
MFVLASADTAITLHFVFRYMLRGQMTPWRYVYPVYLLFVTNNVIADSLILYRCYMVWGRRKSIIAGPCLLLLVSTVCGYVFNAASSPNLRKLQPVYLWMTFALNISVTLLTASRILWFAHTARAILGPEMARRYYSITVIVVESGAIYSLYVLLDLVVATIVLDAALIQVVGIVPTLIIVQVGLGRVVQDVETTINFHRTEVRSSDTPVLDSIFSTTSAAPQTAQHTRTSFNDHHTTQITQVPSRPEGNHHV